MSPEELYLQLGNLVEQMPDLANGPITQDVNKWLGRATALVTATGAAANAITLQVASQNLNTQLRDQNAQTISAIVYAALATAELAAPAPVRGTFITAGHTFDAFAAVSKVFSTAAIKILLVDPYADETVVIDYVGLAPDNVAVQILADDAAYNRGKKTLKPAVNHWKAQHGQHAMLLEARLAPSGTLHDRLVIVDDTWAWDLGQSFNKLAVRAHTSLVRSPKDIGDEKIAAYASLWTSATPL
jgi:hypothetical protein